MERVQDAQDAVAETLAWLLYGGNREVAEWAANAGWVLVAYEVIPRKTWSRECDLAARWRGDAFIHPSIRGGNDGADPSSPRL